MGEGVGGRGEDGEGRRAGGLSARHAPLVGDEHGVDDAGRRRQRGEQLVGVGELRDRLRGDEARRLDLAQARRHQPLDEAALGRERDRGRLVLQAVPWPDLVDPDAVSQVARGSDERRIHRPLDPGDVDLDALQLVRRIGPGLAEVRGRIAPSTRRLVQRQQRRAVIRKRLRSRSGSRHGESVPLRLDHGEDVAACNLVA
jgi:hypothetical protein